MPKKVLGTTNGETTIPAIQAGIGKFGEGPTKSSYTSGSSFNGRPRPRRTATSYADGGHVTPPPNPAKKQKTEHRPPPVNEKNITALPNRSQREQQQMTATLAPRPKPNKITTYQTKGVPARPGVAVTKKNGMKEKAKREEAPPEVIMLDGDSDEEEVMPQVNQSVPRPATPRIEPTSHPVSASEMANGAASHRPTLSEFAASAASRGHAPLVSQTHDSLAEHLDPTTSLSPRPMLPPTSQLTSTRVSRDDPIEHFETTGYSVGGVEPPTPGKHTRWTSGNTTPVAARQRLPELAPERETEPETVSDVPMRYARTYKLQTERSESPEDYGVSYPTLDSIPERPFWIDKPDAVDDTDVQRLQQIPEHLRMNFVALANELESQDVNYWQCGAEDYLELRGWANQAIQTPGGAGNEPLTVNHAIAALKCWRLVKSRAILKAEREGTLFTITENPPAGQSEPDGDVPMVSASPEEPTATDQSGSSRNALPPAPQITSTSKQPALPATPRGTTPIEIVASPEVSKQNATQRPGEEIDTFGSPVTREARQSADDIQSPVRGIGQPLSREEPIEDTEAADENGEPDFEIVR